MKICMNETVTIKQLADRFQLSERLLKDSNPSLQNEQIPEGAIIEIPGWRGVNSSSSIGKFINIADIKKVEPITKPVIQPKRHYHFQSLVNDIGTLKAFYPFMKERIIGYSVLGNPLIELIIGCGPKKVHMNGSFHANEWITSAIMMKWLNDYLRKLVLNEYFSSKPVREFYENITLSYVPMVNPDGINLVLGSHETDVEIRKQAIQLNGGSTDFSNWKSNVRGVDLNNQYPAFWEIEKRRKPQKTPSPRDYPGDRPLSEPEAMAMAELAKRSLFDIILAFHTQGEEIYWGYLNYEPEVSELIVKDYERASGYKAVQTIDSHAGFRDWFIKEFRKPGFTVELGAGTNPLPLSQFDEIDRKANGIFWTTLFHFS